MTTPTRRRLRVESVTLNLHALGTQPALHLGLDLLELVFRSGLEAHHQHRLRIRSTNEAPSVTVKNAYTIDSEDVVLRPKILLRFVDDPEFLVVRTIDTNLGRRDKAWNVGQQIANAFPRFGDDVEQARRAIQRVVEAVESFGEEHVTRH